MADSLGALVAARHGGIVGRDDELACLRALLDDDGPLVAIVHGLAGSGKSTLVRTFGREAVAAGATLVAIDGREVEPTPAGVLAALGRSLGAPGRDALAALAALPGPVVVTIDTAERLRLVDAWLRLELLPSLPARARVVIATRDAPGAAWRSSFGEVLSTVLLAPLAPADAAEVLRRAGLDEDQAAWVNRFVHGHALSLQLAASALRERPHAAEDAVLPTVVQELAALYLDGLDPSTRDALDATSVLRRVTLSLLGAVLPGAAPQDVFARLAALPFVELGHEGLVVHDTVREAVCALLRATDPVRHRAHRRNAWRQIRREIEGATGPARWASLADMIHLVEEPLVREAFLPSAVQHYAVEPGREGDLPAVETIVGRHDPLEQVALVRAWWEAVPAAFRVARSPRGDVVAFTILGDLADVPGQLLSADPLCAVWRAHLREQPVPRGQRVLLARAALAFGTGAAPSPCLAALLRDMERASLEAGPALRRIYSHAPPGILEQIAPLGYVPLEAEGVTIGDRLYHPVVCDLGPESVAGWLSAMAARDLCV
ncbi:MAG TPA: AAA family ATPase, partial [Solirubrobacteraceae bacterium]